MKIDLMCFEHNSMQPLPWPLPLDLSEFLQFVRVAIQMGVLAL